MGEQECNPGEHREGVPNPGQGPVCVRMGGDEPSLLMGESQRALLSLQTIASGGSWPCLREHHPDISRHCNVFRRYCFVPRSTASVHRVLC